MDSTAKEGARDAKQARLSLSAGDVDLMISGLDDDVLLRVLGLVPDARDAVRTAALSRRWLRLWMRVPALRFASRPGSRAARGAERRAALEEFVSFVNVVLAHRARSDCAIEALSISYTSGPARNREERMQASIDAVQGWI
uniref:F-box domain-containing protein n=1 Tax=Setaria italica TaxID=4555 RepID=K3Y353_SETIT